MKHTTINLVKFKALGKRLELPLFQTIGLLEGLWLFCAHNARDGNLSKFEAREIAAWLDYEADEVDLFDALVETRWVDRDDEGGLAIHHWDQEKPNWLKALDSKKHPRNQPRSRPSRNKKSGKFEQATTAAGTEPDTEPAAIPSTAHGGELGTIPPNETKRNETSSSSGGGTSIEAEDRSWGELEEVLENQGMSRAAAAAAEARRRGLTLEEARNMISEWKSFPGRWGVGALYDRLVGKAATWPADSPAYLQQRQRDSRRYHRAAARPSAEQMAAVSAALQERNGKPQPAST